MLDQERVNASTVARLDIRRETADRDLVHLQEVAEVDMVVAEGETEEEGVLHQDHNEDQEDTEEVIQEKDRHQEEGQDQDLTLTEERDPNLLAEDLQEDHTQVKEEAPDLHPLTAAIIDLIKF
jgi:hypothetical protein